jgi:hypothetical protein
MNEPHRWRSPLLGESHQLSLAQGTVEYFRRGSGRPLVFAHGWLANANLWRQVVDLLADRFDCIALDLPFGAHRIGLEPNADLSAAGCGALIAGASTRSTSRTRPWSATTPAAPTPRSPWPGASTASRAWR